MADKNYTLTSANLVPLGIGIALGAGLLFMLIEIWPAVMFSIAGYCIYKGVNSNSTPSFH